jgi:hypothetical protein
MTNPAPATLPATINDDRPSKRGRPRKAMPPEVLEGAIRGDTTTAIVERTGLPLDAVRKYLKRHAADIGNLREVRTPELMGAFHDLAFRAFEKTLDPKTSMGDLRNASITMGVATDKLQLLSGQPTAIVAGIHEHRHDLSAIAARLANVQRQLPATDDVIEAEDAQVDQGH